MRSFKKIASLTLAFTLLLSCLSLFSCTGAKEAEYTVNVKDALGNAFTSGIIVKFMQGDEQIAMQAIDDKGVAKKTLSKGDYTVELDFTGDKEAYYYAGGAKLSAKETTVDVILANKITGDPVTVTASGDEYDAYAVGIGCTYVELDKNIRNYFLFTPTQGGHYVFSVADGAKVDIGYYGAPHFIQSLSVSEVKDNTFEIDVKDGMIGQGDGGTAVYVIGIDAADPESTSCVLAINRTGDATKTIEDEPWTEYKGTHTPEAYVLPEGAEIKEFDLTAKTDEYKFVLDKKTGYYHLNSADGPVVLVRLAEDCDYIACYATILDKQGVVKYFFDGEEKTYENFVKKENYSNCLLSYIDCADEATGVYPLTEDLMYIIQQNGDHMGWWNPEGSNYRFLNTDDTKDLTINTEIAWLLMCCYAE
ncbi:MAG: hypothetical protein E7647_01970 [Ruminococcaceae bacterium]|nr:hypothetical protein [Oscillospiraceae bacterium]